MAEAFAIVVFVIAGMVILLVALHIVNLCYPFVRGDLVSKHYLVLLIPRDYLVAKHVDSDVVVI